MFTYTIGRVEDVDGQYVATRFLAFIGPLLPLSSLYVEHSDVTRSGNVTSYQYAGTPLPLRPLSILLGYLRVWLPLTALVWPFVSMWGQRIRFEWNENWAISTALLAVWVLTIFLPRLSVAEKARRRVLKSVTGLSVHPRHLSSLTRRGQVDDFEETLSVRGLPRGAAACGACVPSLAHEDLPLVFAYATYAAVRDRAFAPVARAAWDRLSGPTTP